MHLKKRLTCFINILSCNFQLLKFNLHLRYNILFKSLLIKILLNSIITRFLNCNINKIYNYEIKVNETFLVKRYNYNKSIINVINR